MADIDRATLDAVKHTRKEIAAQESHKRQLRRNTARKRANLQVIATRSQANREMLVAREQAARRQRIEKATEKVEQREASQSSGWETGGRTAGTAVANVGQGIGGHELLSTTLWLMFGLIIVYVLVTNGAQFSGFTKSLGDLLAKVTTTQPLFQVADKSTS